MINSRNSLHQSCLAFGALLSLTLASFQVTAQEKPRNLVPTLGSERVEEPEKGDDQAADPFSPAGQAQTETQLLQQGSNKNALVVERLDALSPSTTGLLSNDKGGFGAQMWNGTRSELADALLHSLPVKTKSPQLLDLRRRLLLTGALLSQNQNEANKHLNLRFEKLRSAGLTQDAAHLFSRLQFDTTSDKNRKMSAEISLLLNQSESACELGRRQSGHPKHDVFWTKLDVFCQLLSDEYDKAELGVALLEEQGEKDAFFYDLFAVLAGDSAPIEINNRLLKPLHIAMMRHAKISFNLTEDDNLSLENLEALVVTPELFKAGGVRAAFEATEFNRANTQYLQQALLLSSKKANETQETTVFKAYAKLYDSLITADDDALKASRLLAFWDLAQANNQFSVISSVTAEQLLSLVPKNYGPEFNGRALRSLLLLGELDKAGLWERVIRRAASQGNIAERLKARTEIAHLDAFMLISGANAIARWNSSSFPAWKKAMENDPAKGAKTELLLSVFEVFGLPVSEDNWQDLLLMGVVPQTAEASYGVNRNLVSAAIAGRLAETVSLSLMALGEDGAAKASTTSLIAVLTGLKAVGLEAEARQLAIEALILKGF